MVAVGGERGGVVVFGVVVEEEVVVVVEVWCGEVVRALMLEDEVDVDSECYMTGKSSFEIEVPIFWCVYEVLMKWVGSWKEGVWGKEFWFYTSRLDG